IDLSSNDNVIAGLLTITITLSSWYIPLFNRLTALFAVKILNLIPLGTAIFNASFSKSSRTISSLIIIILEIFNDLVQNVAIWPCIRRSSIRKLTIPFLVGVTLDKLPCLLSVDWLYNMVLVRFSLTSSNDSSTVIPVFRKINNEILSPVTI